jgi:hypothetical protein
MVWSVRRMDQPQTVTDGSSTPSTFQRSERCFEAPCTKPSVGGKQQLALPDGSLLEVSRAFRRPRACGYQWTSSHTCSLLSDDSNTPFANARVWASAIRNCHNHDDFVRTWRIGARNSHRIEMIKRPNIILVG